MIRRSQRGRLKVYLGYGPGVGKTYRMLLEAHRLKGEGIDVVVGLVETHGRAETAKLIEGLEVVPRRKVEYHQIIVEEMDVDAVIARHPQVAIVDELAHTNVPGSKNGKRYQDVQDILAAGIHVISTLNIQHLESLYNTVEQLIGVKVRERIPDSVLAEADQIINIDLSAEDLQQRLREGKIYPTERVETSLDNFFTRPNLEHLRELALRELASQIDFKRRETASEKVAAPTDGSPDQIMVCLSSRRPNSARLLRYASRLAGRLNRNWYAVYVQTPSEEPTVIERGHAKAAGGYADAGQSAWGDGLHVQGSERRGYDPAFCAGIPGGPGGHRPAPADAVVETGDGPPQRGGGTDPSCPGGKHHRGGRRERGASNHGLRGAVEQRDHVGGSPGGDAKPAADAAADRHLGRSRAPAGGPQKAG